MEFKRVSYKVAKAIKDAGYPQNENKLLYRYVLGFGIKHECAVLSYGIKDEVRHIDYISAPEYLDVWLWLWREKRKSIDVAFNGYSWESSENCEDCKDPEESIVAAIEYLCENNLIK